MPEHSGILTGHALKKKKKQKTKTPIFPEPKLLGFFESLINLGKEKYPLQPALAFHVGETPDYSHSVPLQGETGSTSDLP